MKSKSTIFGFGHPYYPGESDPRIELMRPIINSPIVDKDSKTYKIIMALRDEMYKTKKIYANIELYMIQFYLECGFPGKILSNINLLSRIGGLCAHVLEQKNVNKKIYLHPQNYIGDVNKILIRPKF